MAKNPIKQITGIPGVSGTFDIQDNTLVAGDGITITESTETGHEGERIISASGGIPTTTTASKVLVSTTTSGTAKWSDFSSAGFLKTNASGVVSSSTSLETGTVPNTVTTSNGILVYNSSNQPRRMTTANAKTLLGIPSSFPSTLYRYRRSIKSWTQTPDSTCYLWLFFDANINTLSGKTVNVNFYNAANGDLDGSVTCTNVKISNVRFYIEEDYDDGEGEEYRMLSPVTAIYYWSSESDDNYGVNVHWHRENTHATYGLLNGSDIMDVTNIGTGTAID